jgi:hypothetical protein
MPANAKLPFVLSSTSITLDLLMGENSKVIAFNELIPRNAEAKVKYFTNQIMTQLIVAISRGEVESQAIQPNGLPLTAILCHLILKLYSIPSCSYLQKDTVSTLCFL